MIRLSIPLLAGLLLASAGCKPKINPDFSQKNTDDNDNEDPTDTDTDIEAERCTQPENPENGEHTLIEMEVRGCGAFDNANDADIWDVELEDDAAAGGWMSLRLYAESMGSRAKPHLAVRRYDGDPSLPSSREDSDFLLKVYKSDGASDPNLAFPSKAAFFQMLLTEITQKGGEAYIYDVLATTIKQPLVWTVDEKDTVNDEYTDAQVLSDGDVVFGHFAVDDDEDWYQIAIPPGKGTLKIDVDAYEFGSAADVFINLRDTNKDPLPSCGDCYYQGGPGYSPAYENWDPLINYSTNGDEIVNIRVFKNMQNDLDGHGTPYWYTFKVEIEQ